RDVTPGIDDYDVPGHRKLHSLVNHQIVAGPRDDGDGNTAKPPAGPGSNLGVHEMEPAHRVSQVRCAEFSELADQAPVRPGGVRDDPKTDPPELLGHVPFLSIDLPLWLAPSLPLGVLCCARSLPLRVLQRAWRSRHRVALCSFATHP